MAKGNKYSVVILEKPSDLADWKTTTQAQLRGKGVWNVVDGTDPEPSNNAGDRWRKWDGRRNVAASIIISTIARSQLPHIRSLTNDPAAMWARLIQMHRTNGATHHMSLWQDFDGLKYDGSRPMADHIADLRSMADQLKELFNDGPSSAKFIATLTASLPTETNSGYADLVRSLEGDVLETNVDHVIQRVTNEWNRQERSKKKETEVKKMKEEVESSEDEEKNEALMAQMAMALAGMMRQRKKRTKSKITCFKCGGRGHVKNMCPTRSDDEEDAHVVIGPESSMLAAAAKLLSVHSAIGDSEEDDSDDGHPNVAV